MINGLTSKPKECYDFLVEHGVLRQPDSCSCGCKLKVILYRKKCFYRCTWSGCRKRFSVTNGTILDNTKLSLHEWVLMMYFCGMQTPFEAMVEIDAPMVFMLLQTNVRIF